MAMRTEQGFTHRILCSLHREFQKTTLDTPHILAHTFTQIKHNRTPASVTVRMDWLLLQTLQETQALQT